MISTIDFDKLGGLVPAVVQHATTRRVLMLGFMTREALEATLRDRLVTFWSRSRGRLWRKGESSGNVLSLVSAHIDCDRDALLLLAEPAGPVCHTGAATCFDAGQPDGLTRAPHREADVTAGDILRELEATIRSRIDARDEGSYTWRLARAGTGRVAQKVGEEGVEVALAAVAGTREDLENESADLLYHLLVLLAERGSSLGEVARVLAARAGQRTSTGTR